MPLRVKVFPSVSYLEKFLKNKGFDLVVDGPQILHYVGNNEKDLKTIYKLDRPDLLITHKISAFKILPDVPQVYYPLTSEKELLQIKKVQTNSFRLCKTYFERIGLQAEILTIPSKEERKAAKLGINLQKRVGWLANIWRGFISWMNW